MTRTALVLAAGVLVISPAVALQFPETSCVTPEATVTSITGIDTRDARMVGRYTLPDIQEGCYQGWVDQGGSVPPAHCVEVHLNLLHAPPLHASADCIAGTLTFEGRRFRMPVSNNCASGGIYAIKAFKTLCPNYGGKIESDD
jgi:hypothetical protein